MIDLNSIPLPACLINADRSIDEYNSAFEEQVHSRCWPVVTETCFSEAMESGAAPVICMLNEGRYQMQRIPVAEGTKYLCTLHLLDSAETTGQDFRPEPFGGVGFREDSEVAGIALNKDYEIVRLNTAARRLFGSVGVAQTGLISPKIAGLRELQLLGQLEEKQELRFSSKIHFGYYELRMRRHNGFAAPVHIIIRIHELSSRVRVYKRLQECNYRYKTVFQNVRIGLFQTTPQGKLITANPALAHMLGYASPAQLMREVKNMRDIYVHPTRRDAIIHHIETHGFVADVESDVCRRDGSITRISGTTVGMKDSNNRLIMLQGTIVDTRRYGKQQKVLEILRNTLLKISDSILVTDFEHEVIYVNKAFTRLYGYRLEELRRAFEGTGARQQRARQISWSDMPVINEQGRESSMGAEIREKGSYSGEFINYTKDGREIMVSVAASLIQDEFGAPLAHIIISRDITEKHEAEKNLLRAKKQAEAADQLKANILSNMSHELRTPLTGIIGFASILKDMLAGQDEELLYFIDNIKQSGERLLETLNTLLMVSDIDSQRVRYHFRYVPLREVAEDCMQRMEKQSGQLHLEVGLEEETPGVQAYADYDLLRQAFEKVYKNALKFTEKGRVCVRIGREEDGRVFMSVADTGVGIPEDELESIFSPFTQVSSGISRKYQGTGLGLYVCKSYMKLLGGEISVESVKGEGSVFTLHLPARKPLPESQD